jgi:hypothetical protein
MRFYNKHQRRAFARNLLAASCFVEHITFSLDRIIKLNLMRTIKHRISDPVEKRVNAQPELLPVRTPPQSSTYNKERQWGPQLPMLPKHLTFLLALGRGERERDNARHLTLTEKRIDYKACTDEIKMAQNNP